MHYTLYQQSRNLSWEVLINEGVSALPVKMGELCAALGLEVIITELNSSSGDGKAVNVDGKPYILIDGRTTVQRQRFTIAHEVGHVLLGHIGRYELVNREPAPGDNPIEQAANVFASRLLAPACVLWALNVHTPEEIAELCGISRTAAEFRARRMELLYAREARFLKDKGQSCFLSSPLEREVFEQFRDFINRQKG